MYSKETIHIALNVNLETTVALSHSLAAINCSYMRMIPFRSRVFSS